MEGWREKGKKEAKGEEKEEKRAAGEGRRWKSRKKKSRAAEGGE